MISLFENAVKHSDIKTNPNGYIKVEAIVENSFIFTIINSCDSSELNDNGTGMKNIIQQLDLTYGENYTFDAAVKDKQYKLKLSIDSSNLSFV